MNWLPPPYRRPTGQQGFTLIEMLIGLTLVGMIAVGLFAGLRFGARVWERVETRATEVRAWDASAALIRRMLAGVVPRLILPDGDWLAGLEGTDRSIRFLAAWNGAFAPRGMYLFELEKARRENDLMLRWRPTRAVSGADGGTVSERALVGGLDALEVRYFGRWGDSQTAEWRADWPPNRRLPQLIEIRLAGQAAAGHPPLRVLIPGADGL